MQEILPSLLKRTSIFIIIIGVILLLVGAAGEVVISTFSLRVPDIGGRAILGIIGLCVIGFGAYCEWREHAPETQSPIKSKGQTDYFRIWETRDSRGKEGGFEQAVGAARKEILTGSINFETTATRYLSLLREKAEQGCTVKFLTIRPRMPDKKINPVLAATAQTIGKKTDNLLEQIESNLEIIWNEGQKLPEAHRQHWQVRVHQTIGTIFLSVDGDEPHGTLFLSFYPYGVIANNDWPMIELRPSSLTGHAYRIFYNSFCKMFDEAQDWRPT